MQHGGRAMGDSRGCCAIFLVLAIPVGFLLMKLFPAPEDPPPFKKTKTVAIEKSPQWRDTFDAEKRRTPGKGERSDMSSIMDNVYDEAASTLQRSGPKVKVDCGDGKPEDGSFPCTAWHTDRPDVKARYTVEIGAEHTVPGNRPGDRLTRREYLVEPDELPLVRDDVHQEFWDLAKAHGGDNPTCDRMPKVTDYSATATERREKTRHKCYYKRDDEWHTFRVTFDRTEGRVGLDRTS